MIRLGDVHTAHDPEPELSTVAGSDDSGFATGGYIVRLQREYVSCDMAPIRVLHRELIGRGMSAG